MTRQVKLIVTALLCIPLLLGASAQASRNPTRTESREIHESAKLYLEGKGWHVSGIRISTVNGHYAKAAVRQAGYGPGGQMILLLRHGIWHEVFLGTSEFCRAHVPRQVLEDLGFHC
jgi:hypothetical protein